MIQVIEPLTKNYSVADIEQAEYLKNKGIALIQKICSQTWTDHNSSDPGITILEVLAFIIQELSSRLALPIEQLLLPNPELSSEIQQFFLPQDVLPSNPVTLADHRRSLIDIPGIKNADVAPCSLLRDLNDPNSKIRTGLFDIRIDLDDHLLLEQDEVALNAKKEALLKQVQQVFVSQRNVNEDIASISIIPKQKLSIAMHVSIDKSVDPMLLISKLFSQINESIAPAVTKYHYSDMVAQGLSGNETFDGPLLYEGFIRAKDVEQLSLPATLYASDILANINSLTDINHVKSFHFLPLDVDSNNTDVEEEESLYWRIDIPSGFIASFDVINSYSLLSLDIDGQAFQLPSLSQQQCMSLLTNDTISQGSGIPNRMTAYIEGKYQQLQPYTSLQHDLPKLYRLTDRRLNDPVTDEEIASILQFKGYLSLFDQVLADQFAQLEMLKTLLALPDHHVFTRLANTFSQMLASESLTPRDVTQFWQDIRSLPKTQISQAVEGISGMAPLLGDYFEQYRVHAFQEYAEPIFSQQQLDRLKRSVEHLLSRFSETGLDVSLLKYQDVFNHYLPIIQKTKNALSIDIKKLVAVKQIVDLVMLINNYPTISTFRTGGVNYLSKEPKHNHLGGLSQRILRFLGVSTPGQIPLAVNNKEGVYLVESELIRFGAYLNAPDSMDQYQPNQLYFVAPAWPARFANAEFRSLLEQQISCDSPVYQQSHIIYLCREEMSLFERLYYAWLNALTQLTYDYESIKNVDSNPSNDTQIGTEQSELIIVLATLLRQFFAKPESVLNIILQSFNYENLREKITLWLRNESEINELSKDITDVADANIADIISVLRENLYDILYARYQDLDACEHTQGSFTRPNNASSSNTIDDWQTLEEKSEFYAKNLSYQILFTICQQQLDIIARPNAIRRGVIGSSFRVGYQPLQYLKPSYPICSAEINAQQPDSSAFSLGIKQPLVI